MTLSIKNSNINGLYLGTAPLPPRIESFLRRQEIDFEYGHDGEIIFKNTMIFSGSTRDAFQQFSSEVSAEFSKSINLLRSEIDGMRRTPFHAELVNQLADSLRDQLNVLQKDMGENIFNTDYVGKYATFEKKFKDTFRDEKYQVLIQRQKMGWKSLVGNLLILLTGIGALLLIAKMAYSRYTSGHASMFFAPSPRINVNKIEKKCSQIKKVIYG